MIFHFDPNQNHQVLALQTIKELFRATSPKKSHLSKNPTLNEAQLFENLVNMLAKKNHQASCRTKKYFQLELETGTGKTYIYFRSIFELYLQNNIKNFVIVVPNIAVKETVLKHWENLQKHFSELYPSVKTSFSVYQKANETLLNTLVLGTELKILLLNIDTFSRQENILRKTQENGKNLLSRLADQNPLLILDEAHHFQTKNRQEALDLLQPCATLAFSATLPSNENLIFRLTPIEAFENQLVKQIEVKAFPPQANPDKQLFEQMQYCIRTHFLKEKALKRLNIKVLTLFFVDKVANYRPTKEQKGKFAQWFEQIYLDCQKEFPDVLNFSAEQVHDGYFSVDKQQMKDSSGKTQADQAVYQLIMKDKERLLSQDEPLRFIFSHSALREGWDNPNVFQICTLNPTHSNTKKRQEIGRGLRLAVDQNGQRIKDKNINVLTVVANQHYEQFCIDLQNEYDSTENQKIKIQDAAKRQIFWLDDYASGQLFYQKVVPKIIQKTYFLVSKWTFFEKDLPLLLVKNIKKIGLLNQANFDKLTRVFQKEILGFEPKHIGSLCDQNAKDTNTALEKWQKLILATYQQTLAEALFCIVSQEQFTFGLPACQLYYQDNLLKSEKLLYGVFQNQADPMLKDAIQCKDFQLVAPIEQYKLQSPLGESNGFVFVLDQDDQVGVLLQPDGSFLQKSVYLHFEAQGLNMWLYDAPSHSFIKKSAR